MLLLKLAPLLTAFADRRVGAREPRPQPLRAPQRERKHAARRAQLHPPHLCPCLKREGIDDFRWHDLRHTFARRLIMRRVDLRSVQELLGHTDIKMTLRYSYLSPAHLLAAVERLPQAPTDTATRTDGGADDRARGAGM